MNFGYVTVNSNDIYEETIPPITEECGNQKNSDKIYEWKMPDYLDTI